MSEKEIKPCPACGDEAMINRDYDADGFGKFISYKCSDCGFQSRAHFCSEECPITYQEIRDTWNKQPRIDQLEAKVQKLTKLVSRLRPDCEVPKWVYEELKQIL